MDKLSQSSLVMFLETGISLAHIVPGFKKKKKKKKNYIKRHSNRLVQANEELKRMAFNF